MQQVSLVNLTSDGSKYQMLWSHLRSPIQEDNDVYASKHGSFEAWVLWNFKAFLSVMDYELSNIFISLWTTYYLYQTLYLVYVIYFWQFFVYNLSNVNAKIESQVFPRLHMK